MEVKIRRGRKGSMVWDKKSKKYVRVQDDKKRVKTESGVYIAATYKTNRYAKWKERSKLAQQTEDQEDESSSKGQGQGGRKRAGGPLPSSHPAVKKARNAVPAHKKGPRSEIQRPEQIMKKRAVEEKKAARKQKGGGKGKKAARKQKGGG